MPACQVAPASDQPAIMHRSQPALNRLRQLFPTLTLHDHPPLLAILPPPPGSIPCMRIPKQCCQNTHITALALPQNIQAVLPLHQSAIAPKSHRSTPNILLHQMTITPKSRCKVPKFPLEQQHLAASNRTAAATPAAPASFLTNSSTSISTHTTNTSPRHGHPALKLPAATGAAAAWCTAAQWASVQTLVKPKQVAPLVEPVRPCLGHPAASAGAGKMPPSCSCKAVLPRMPQTCRAHGRKAKHSSKAPGISWRAQLQ